MSSQKSVITLLPPRTSKGIKNVANPKGGAGNRRVQPSIPVMLVRSHLLSVEVTSSFLRIKIRAEKETRTSFEIKKAANPRAFFLSQVEAALPMIASRRGKQKCIVALYGVQHETVGLPVLLNSGPHMNRIISTIETGPLALFTDQTYAVVDTRKSTQTRSCRLATLPALAT